MTPRTWLLLGWIVIGAAGLVAHAVLLWQIFRSDKLHWGWRLVGLVFPLLAPIIAWVAGKRAAVIVWGVLVALYIGLRVMVDFV